MSNQTTKTRDSFILYRSFIESLEGLKNDEKLAVYEAISYYALDQKEPKLTGISKSIFTLIRPQLDANHKRYINGCKGAEHGKLGGRPKNNNPKKTPRKPQKNPKLTPNDNVNVNENKNLNNNDNKNDLPIFINRDLFNSFAEMRNKIKKPLTDKAKELLIKKLTEFENKQAGFANKALENSIESSWQGVFEPKQNNHNNQQKTTESFDKSKWEQYV